MMRALLLIALLARPCAAQVFPHDIKDTGTNENLYYLYQLIQSINNGGSSGTYIPIGAAFGGDVSGTYGAIVVGDDSHSHGDTTLTGIDGSKVTGTGVLDLDVLAPGGLPATVYASSVAVNSVTDTAIVSMSASKLTGALPAIDGSALTGIAGVFEVDIDGGLMPSVAITSDSFWEEVAGEIEPI